MHRLIVRHIYLNNYYLKFVAEKAQKGKHHDGAALDIDMNDPELNKAATKIQAQFRGHLARKHLKEHDHQS